MILPKKFLEPPKKYVSVTFPFCKQNKFLSKKLVEKVHFTLLEIIKFNLVICTKKGRSWEWTCGETSVGETIRNVEVRWGEHEFLRKIQNPQGT